MTESDEVFQEQWPLGIFFKVSLAKEQADILRGHFEQIRR